MKLNSDVRNYTEETNHNAYYNQAGVDNMNQYNGNLYKETYDTVSASSDLKERLMDMKHNNGKMNRTSRKGKAVAAVAAFIILAGAGVKAASTLWDARVAGQFGVADSEEKMQELTDKGFSEKIGDTQEDTTVCTDHGITIRVVQSVADDNFINLLIEAESDDTVILAAEDYEQGGEGVYFPDFRLYYNEKDEKHLLGGTGSCLKVYSPHRVAYEYTFEPNSGNYKEGDIIYFDGHGFDMGEGGYNYDPPYEKLDGKWEMNWFLSYGDEKRVFSINKEVEIEGEKVIVKEVSITPFSYRIMTQTNADMDSEKWTYVTCFRGLYYGDDYYGNKSDENTELDQSSLTAQVTSGLGGTSVNDSKGLRNGKEYGAFSIAVDIDKVTAVNIGGAKVELTDEVKQEKRHNDVQ